MKINVFISDTFLKYRAPLSNPTILIDMPSFGKIPLEGNQIILRGEPTLHHKFPTILDHLQDHNFVYTSIGLQVEKLISYKRNIPYVSFHYEGHLNDELYGGNQLTAEITKALNHFKTKQTILRLAYTISPFNKAWFVADVATLKNFLSLYPTMKRPYFLVYQQGTYYSEAGFKWTTIDKSMIDRANKAGILTQKNLNYLLAFFNQDSYSCVSPQEEITIFPDGTLRTCMSHKVSEVLGDLHKNSFAEILEMSAEKRKQCKNCNLRQSCWLAYHLKSNI
jgi:MoaA/NifB/PqqE/SkfB family radical SAM enzyme